MSIFDYVCRPDYVEFVGRVSSGHKVQPKIVRVDGGRFRIVNLHTSTITRNEAVVIGNALIDFSRGRDHWKHPPG